MTAPPLPASSGRSPRPILGRFDPKLLAVGFGLFFVWTEITQVWRGWGLPGTLFSYTAFMPLQLAAAAALHRASRRADLPANARRALGYFALTFVMLAAGSATLAIYTIGVHEEPRYTIADAFYVLSYPLIVAGLMLLPRRPAEAISRSRQLLDLAALVITSGILVYVHLTLRADWTGFAQVLATGYPVLALLGLLAVNSALTHGLPVPSRRAWLALMIALAVNLLSDVIFQTLWAIGYQGPNWSLPVYVAVDLAMLWAAGWYARDPLQEPAAARVPVLPFSPLPILLAIGGAGVLLMAAAQGHLAVVRPVLVSLIVVNVLLMVREFLLLLDATRAARLEAEREGERRFEALVRRSTDLILVVDTSHTVRFASAPVAALLGRAPEQVVGQPLADLLHPEDQEGARAILDELLLLPGGAATAAVRLLHADGEWRRFEWSAANLTEEPAVRGMVLNCRDVTERAQLEDQLRQAQKMEVVGQLAGGVAHDFNNLLTTVLAGTDFALQALGEHDPMRAEIDSIRHAAQRGRALTSRLLAFSRPSGAEPRVVWIGEQVAAFRPLMQRLLGESYRLELTVEPGSSAARLNPDELEHALLNLVANARDAMPDTGAIRIGVADRVLAAPIESAVLAVPAGRYVVVEVRDSGHGVDAAVRSRMFQPFFTTKRTGEGTGLGLTGVSDFMRRSGGGITLESSPGAGAAFGLWFPVVEVVRVAEGRPAPTAPVAGTGTILLVEDDDIVRHATRRILAAGGYAVLEASAADEARRIFSARGQELDLLVTDVMMPGESGASLAQAIRAARPDLPVLFISGYPGEDLARLGLRLGEVELLRKPFTVRELTERVREVLALRPTTGRSAGGHAVVPP